MFWFVTLIIGVVVWAAVIVLVLRAPNPPGLPPGGVDRREILWIGGTGTVVAFVVLAVAYLADGVRLW